LKSFLLPSETRTELIGEFLQEFATAIDQLAHSTHVDLPKQLISKKLPVLSPIEFGRETKQQLLLGGRKTLSEALELEATVIAEGTPSGLH
jgi:hypothetical protein